MSFNKSYTGLRLDLIDHIKGKELLVLDVGCATGVNGEYLKDKGRAKRVVGIELDPLMAEIAKTKIDKVIIGNVEETKIFSELADEKFDYILLGDIIEHTYDPWVLLEKLRHCLKDGGLMIISVPNIQHIELFISIYFNGRWPYNERGIFDQTHLRWFTYKNILDLEDRCNIKIIHILRKFRFRDKKSSQFPFYGKILRRIFPALFTFQYIIVAENGEKL